MRNIKYYFIFILTLPLSLGELYSQFNHPTFLNCTTCQGIDQNGQINGSYHSYNPIPLTFNPNEIADDFGPRSDDYDWHGGIDYNGDGQNTDRDDWGDIMIALENGRINGNISGQGFKYIFVDGVHNFGYAHMFRTLRPQASQIAGSSFLGEMLNQNNVFCIIMVINNDTTVIGPDPGLVLFGGDTLSVSTRINNSHPYVGPVGYSGLGCCPSHLHLYSTSRNSTHDRTTKNPLQFINHQTSNYSTTFHNAQSNNPQNIATGINIQYGSFGKSHIIVILETG